jgi:exosortase/archaeosortase family protein
LFYLAGMGSPLVRFTASFFVLLLGFSVLSAATALQNHLHLAEAALAGTATWTAQRLGSAAEVVNGNMITVGSVSLNINHECTGVFVFFVLVSFITAYPARIHAKAIGIVVGIMGLTLVNLIRIVTLVRVVEFYPALFPYFHEYIWQGAFLMLVTVYSMSWVEWVRG